jgi:hypothetical protein
MVAAGDYQEHRVGGRQSIRPLGWIGYAEPTFIPTTIPWYASCPALNMAYLEFPEKYAKVLFLDLEYYVPPSDRKNRGLGGMSYSPWKPDHKVIGGVFRTYYTVKQELRKAKGFWEWHEGSEEKLLKRILEHLKAEWQPLRKVKNASSLVLSGIGIVHSDIPVLFARFLHYQLAPADELYQLLYGARSIDLSTLGITQFGVKSPYLAYPISKAVLYNKYLPNKRMDKADTVWGHYDNKAHASIEDRCREEVEDCVVIYKAILDEANAQRNAVAQLKRLAKGSSI